MNGVVALATENGGETWKELWRLERRKQEV
jgi:hypothetical protein